MNIYKPMIHLAKEVSTIPEFFFSYYSEWNRLSHQSNRRNCSANRRCKRMHRNSYASSRLGRTNGTDCKVRKKKLYENNFFFGASNGT